MDDEIDLENATREEISQWVADYRPRYNRDPKFLGKWAKRVKPAQKDSYYVSWLETIEPTLELYFFTDNVDLPDDPYTKEALIIAEQQFLAYYPTLETVWTDVDQEIQTRSTRFVMYLGEVFRRNFDVRWVNIPKKDMKHGLAYNVKPWGIDALYDFWHTLTSTAYRRTGTEWEMMWNYAAESYQWWKESGLPPVWEEPSCRIFG